VLSLVANEAEEKQADDGQQLASGDTQLPSGE